MPQPGEPGWPDSRGHVPPDADDLDLAHLFDYCRTLLGQDAEAIRTARSVLDSPHEPLPDRETVRAWLFGLARSLVLALRPSGRDEPSYTPHALTAVPSRQADNAVLWAFSALTHRDREILDLVYRHGIRPADLPAVLIVPAEEVHRRLVNAEEQFISLAAGSEYGPSADPEDIAALPLAALPTPAQGASGAAWRGHFSPESAPGRTAVARRAFPPPLAAVSRLSCAPISGGKL